MKVSRIRQASRIGLVAALLPLALASAAQGTLKWQGQQAAAATTQPIASRIPASPQTIPALDVRGFEAVAQQLVAGGRIPGLAVAIVADQDDPWPPVDDGGTDAFRMSEIGHAGIRTHEDRRLGLDQFRDIVFHHR